MFQKTCKTLGYMKIIVFEIPGGGGGGGSKTISIPWPIWTDQIKILISSPEKFI